jgi:Tol biopolymer transport system component
MHKTPTNRYPHQAGDADDADAAGGGANPTGPVDAARAADGAADAADAADAAVKLSVCDVTGMFGVPVALGSVNTGSIESSPVLTDDELAIYFYSDRPGGIGSTDLYVARRASVTMPFGAATALSSLNSAFGESDPTITPDEKQIVFASARSGSYKLMVAERPSALADFGAPAVLADVNANNGTDSNSFLTIQNAASELWFASSRAGGAGGYDLYRATRSGAGFSSPTPLQELNTAFDDAAPVLSRDGLTLYFASKRTGGASGDFDIWMARRPALASPFGAPSNVAELNTTGFDRPGWLSPDGCRLYFGSDRGGSNTEIYVAERMPR